jgi:hypothetical protein
VGYAWDADEEYWEALRRKNGGWWTLGETMWQLLTSTTPEYQFPGSKSLNEGDWAVMADSAKASADTVAAGDDEDDKNADR